MTYKLAILIAEDVDFWLKRIKAYIEAVLPDIEVDWQEVKSVKEAKKLLDTKRYHILIVDNQLYVDEKHTKLDDNGGIEILKYVKKQNLAFDEGAREQYMHNIFISARSKSPPERFLESVNLLNAITISKDKNATEINPKPTFKESIEHYISDIVSNSLRINFAFYDTLEEADKQSIEDAVANITPADNANFQFSVKNQIYDILGKLIPINNNIQHTSVETLNPGLSGSAILRIQTFKTSRGSNPPYAIKLTRREKAFRESTCYQNWVTDVADIPGSPILHQQDVKYTYELGGIKYQFAAGVNGADLWEFEQAYFQNEEEILRDGLSRVDIENRAATFIACLKELFYGCQNWYRNENRIVDRRLLQIEYYKALGMIEIVSDGDIPPNMNKHKYADSVNYKTEIPEKLTSRFYEILPQIYVDQTKTQFTERLTLRIDEYDQNYSEEVTNPFKWLIKYSNKLRINASFCTTHGDLNTRNIMVSQNLDTAWLIDFYRTGESHFLRDFVLLETDIKFRLLIGNTDERRISVEEFKIFEENLLRDHSQPNIQYDIDKLPSHAKFAFYIIIGIRQHVISEYMQANKYQVEYSIALLMVTLNYLRMKRKEVFPPYMKKLAFLSTSMLCDHLSKLLGIPQRITTTLPVMDDTNSRDRRIETILQKLRDDKLIIMIGSANESGEPSLAEFANDMRGSDDEESDVILARLSNDHGSDLRAMVKAYFAKHEPPERYKRIAQLGLPDIFTAKIHTYLQESYEDLRQGYIEIVNPSDRLVNTDSSVNIYAIHGSLSTAKIHDTSNPPLLLEAERFEKEEQIKKFYEILRDKINSGYSLLVISPTLKEARKISRECYVGSNENSTYWAVEPDFGQTYMQELDKKGARFLTGTVKNLLEYLLAH